MDGTYAITQCAIQPNTSFTYNFTLQQGGTYWWHAHWSTTYQDGLFGPLIIHGRDEPDYNVNGDIVLMVDDWYHNFSMDLLPAFFAPGNEGVEPVPDNGLINGYIPTRCLVDQVKMFSIAIMRRDTNAITRVRIMRRLMSIQVQDIDSVSLIPGHSPISNSLSMDMNWKYSVLLYSADFR
jgi:FtsP/CotA-like multicopper oxidase with cupredoxin domain